MNLEKSSIEKLYNDGYSFLRLEIKKNKPFPAIIKISSKFGSWRKLSEFKFISDANKEISRLVASEKLKYLYSV